MACSPTPGSSATTPASSMSARMACAGATPNDWFTNSIRSPTPNAPRSVASAPASGGTIAVSRLGAAIHPRRAGRPCRRGSTASSAGKTGFATLDRLLARLRANKSELLRVLERPEIPLNTNGSENDIRCQVTKRKISGGNPQRRRPRLPRRLPEPPQDLRQARHRLLGLPRRTPRSPRLPGNPRPRRNRQRARPQATLIAQTFAPVTENLTKSLKLLARPKRFELLTPRFVVWCGSCSVLLYSVICL